MFNPYASRFSGQAAVFVASLAFCGFAWGQNSAIQRSAWPQFLGDRSDLTVHAPNLNISRGVPKVEVRWRMPLGPGYSQPVVSGEIAYIAFSDGASDRLKAVYTDSGKTKWNYEIGQAWRGIDGSDDGPISTPALGNGVVIGLGPRGQLFALDSKTGDQLWRVDLPSEHGASIPTYGVASSPLVVEQLVIVQIGAGPGKCIAAFDVFNGKMVWSAGDDTVAYQSPLVAEFLGVRQLIAVGGTEIFGINLKEGTVLWKVKYLEKAETHSNPVVVVGTDSFVVTGVQDSVAFRLKRDGESFIASELWRSRELKGSYSVPVALQDTLYGWSGDFFASVNSETGRRNWKTRGIGPGSLLSLGDWLVIWTVDGRLLFAEPSPLEFRQIAETQLAKKGTLVNPVWTGDGLLLRAHDELLSMAVTVAAPLAETHVVPSIEPSHVARFAKLLASIKQEDDATKRGQIIESFLNENKTPLIESDGTVTFLYYGKADDVGWIPGGVPVESALPMVRVEGTDLWSRTEQLNLKGAYVYRFEIDGERPALDPHNKLRASTIMPSSLLLMKGYRPAAALAPDAVTPSEKGKTTNHKFSSKFLDNERTVAVYTPAGYDKAKTYPLVLVTSGMDRFFGRMTEILDAAMGSTVEPAVVVIVDVAEPAEMNIFYESLGGRGPLFTRMVIEELLPWVEKKYSVSDQRDRRFLMATLLHGSRALDTALRHPQSFAAVASQSPVMNAAFERELARLLETTKSPPQVYINWCEKDSVALAEATVVTPAIKRMLPKMRSAGVSVTTKELPGGYGWEMFSTQTEAIFSRFLPWKGNKH